MYVPVRAQDRGAVARILLDAAAELGLHKRVVRSVAGGYEVPDDVGHALGVPRDDPDTAPPPGATDTDPPGVDAPDTSVPRQPDDAEHTDQAPTPNTPPVADATPPSDTGPVAERPKPAGRRGGSRKRGA